MEIQLALYLPRDAVSVPVTRQVLDRCMETLGVTLDTRADIALALSEACANVIQHAASGAEYEVRVGVRNCQCVIEVVSAGSSGGKTGGEQLAGLAAVTGSVPATAEHGRGLRIIDAVAENVQLRPNERLGATVHFEKTLDWLPEAPGQHLLQADSGGNERRA
jgi:serine/threonine-protein kinase RsbW